MSFTEGNPYLHPTKRQRSTEGANPLIPRRLDRGFQAIQTVLDGEMARTLMSEEGGVLPPVSLAAHSAEYGDGLFCFENDGRAVPHVLKAFNGLEAAFERAYPGNPEMQRLAMKQITRPVGAAAEAVQLTPDNIKPGLSAKYLGLHSPEVVACKPGVRMLWDFRVYRQTVDDNTTRSSDALADRLNAYGLVLVPYSEETAGRQFNKAAAELVNNSATWERALAGYPGKARPWIAAVTADFRHCQTAFIIGLEMALKRGIVKLNGGRVTNAAAGPAPGEFAGDMTSHDAAARIANLMGLTAPTDPVAPADDASAAKWAEFTHDFAEALYYAASAAPGGEYGGTVNGAVEFGGAYNDATGASFAGRHPGGDVKDDRIGKVVQLQTSHVAQAVSAYAQAVSDVDKWTAGTGMSAAIGGKALIMLHKG